MVFFTGEKKTRVVLQSGKEIVPTEASGSTEGSALLAQHKLHRNPRGSRIVFGPVENVPQLFLTTEFRNNIA